MLALRDRAIRLLRHWGRRRRVCRRCLAVVLPSTQEEEHCRAYKGKGSDAAHGAPSNGANIRLATIGFGDRRCRRRGRIANWCWCWRWRWRWRRLAGISLRPERVVVEQCPRAAGRGAVQKGKSAAWLPIASRQRNAPGKTLTCGA